MEPLTQSPHYICCIDASQYALECHFNTALHWYAISYDGAQYHRNEESWQAINLKFGSINGLVLDRFGRDRRIRLALADTVKSEIISYSLHDIAITLPITTDIWTIVDHDIVEYHAIV
jgi:hypothetical protein